MSQLASCIELNWVIQQVSLFNISRHKFFDDFPSDRHVESPHLLAGGDDLVLGQQKAELSGVAQLHGVAVGDPQLAQRPVQGPAAG